MNETKYIILENGRITSMKEYTLKEVLLFFMPSALDEDLDREPTGEELEEFEMWQNVKTTFDLIEYVEFHNRLCDSFYYSVIEA